ncbi:hypothetical protein H696_03376 [Fonticula alba]|uniref:Uncharacterized protein n=1 Tax=Fonticula alba TaxID=691883 RepID=A0A058Z727_FONAL|nr:hypothetical protein H696_03376 [Fonticula alba]KCV69911.1 hypothetical protein H696_03376 [Fonticula alba]|eukprot:XP_009495517.1 hypothetical protein H696_03376 [Fonticula alba]
MPPRKQPPAKRSAAPAKGAAAATAATPALPASKLPAPELPEGLGVPPGPNEFHNNLSRFDQSFRDGIAIMEKIFKDHPPSLYKNPEPLEYPLK